MFLSLFLIGNITYDDNNVDISITLIHNLPNLSSIKDKVNVHIAYELFFPPFIKNENQNWQDKVPACLLCICID